LYRWQFAVDDIAAIMRDLKIERTHLVGLSMGGYAALQFGLRYPEKTSAIVAARIGSGSHPSHRDAWLRETSVLARIFIEHGMASMSERMARGRCGGSPCDCALSSSLKACSKAGKASGETRRNPCS
jgi:pimeloyl-ACP methyl ester carboxylesterase